VLVRSSAQTLATPWVSVLGRQLVLMTAPLKATLMGFRWERQSEFVLVRSSAQTLATPWVSASVMPMAGLWALQLAHALVPQ